jgi:hypothetical protein
MSKSIKFNQSDRANEARYEAANPKFLGNLHERMKLVMEIVNNSHLWETHHELHIAICDLKTEVSFYDPQEPPFGQRIANPRVD